MVAADDDDGQEARPSGIGRPQSVLSDPSIVAAASDEEDEGGDKHFCTISCICSCLFC